MTVAENVGLAQGYLAQGGIDRLAATEERAAAALALVGCDFDPPAACRI